MTLVPSSSRPSGGGSIPDPVTDTINISPDGLGEGALNIVAAALSNAITVTATSHDGSSGFVAFENDSGRVMDIDSTGGVAWKLFAGASFTLVDAADAGVFSVDSLGNIGFFGAGAVARPVVPLTSPTVQDVIDALVSLGLVSQSD